MSIRKPVVYAAVMFLAFAGAVDAQARAGFGGSFGSRGSNSFRSVPSTRTAPSVSPFGTQSTVGNSGLLRPATGARGMFGGFGRGLMGGLLGAGLFGLLFGNGLFGGLGGLFSVFGLLIQIALLVLVVRFAMGFFRSRQNFANAGASAGGSAAPFGTTAFRNGPQGAFGGTGMSGGSAQPKPLALEKPDFDRFEVTLQRVQAAFSAEDVATLRQLTVSSVADEFASELAENRARGVINRTSDVHFLQGDLAEAWGEAGAEFASVAMQFSLIDATIERASGRVVGGDANRPQQVTEVWTFTRPNGGQPADWRLSAIQQAR